MRIIIDYDPDTGDLRTVASDIEVERISYVMGVIEIAKLQYYQDGQNRFFLDEYRQKNGDEEE